MSDLGFEHLLLIEDDNAVADLLVDLLGHDGVRVQRVADFTSALPLAALAPDIVLMDLGLPDSRGTEGLTTLRQRFPQLPIVVLTGQDDEHVAQACLRAGADDYIRKGRDDRSVLCRVLSYAVQRRSAQAALERHRYDHERLAAVAEHTIHVVLLTDAEGRITWANPSFSRLTGVEASLALGLRPEQALAVEDADAAMIVAHARQAGSACRVELAARVDGRSLYLDYSVVPLGAPGALRGFVEMGLDITHKRRGTVVQAEAAEHFRQVAESVHEVVIACERSLQVNYVSPAIQRLCQISPERVLQQGLAALIVGDDLPRITELCAQVLSSGQPRMGEARLYSGRGSTIECAIEVSGPSASSQPNGGVQLLVTDIHVQRALDRRLRQSEGRWQVLFEAVQDAVLIVSAPATGSPSVVAVNHAACRLLSAERSQLTRLRLSDLIETRHGQTRWMNQWSRLLREGQLRADVPLIARDGHHLMVAMQCTTISWDEQPHVLVLCRDVGAERQAAQAAQARSDALQGAVAASDEQLGALRFQLSKAEAEREALLKLSAHAMWICDTRGCYQQVNSPLALVCGQDPQRMIGRSDRELWPEVQGEHWHQATRRVLDTAQPQREIETVYNADTGLLQEAEVQRVPLRGADGAWLGLAGSLRFVPTKDRRHSAVLPGASEALAGGPGTQRMQFLAQASRELRTPLTGVLCTLDALRHARLDREQHDWAETAWQSASTLVRVLNDVLDHARLDVGLEILERVPYDLHELCLAAAQRAQERLSLAARLVLRIDPQLPSQLIGDPGRLEQLLGHLLDNACAATATGYVGLEVSQLERRGEHIGIQIVVRDSGTGMSEGDVQRLMQGPDPCAVDAQRGGLGMLICRRVVELMAGSLQVRSRLGQGSEVQVTWVAYADLSRESQRLAAAQAYPLAGTQAMIVDALPEAGAALAEILRSAGMQVAVVGTLAEAEERVRSPATTVDVVCFERTSDALPDLCDATLASSAWVLLHTLLRPETLAKEHGFDASLALPCRASTVIRLIELVIEQRRQGMDAFVDSAALIATRPPIRPKLLREGALRRVLLVEDDPIIQRIGRVMLGRRGYQVHFAGDGQAALDAVRTNHWDALLLDCQLPLKDGYDVARDIRSWERRNGGHIPIIAVTANAQEGDRLRCLDAGMDDYIAKPFVEADLLAALERWT